MRKTQIVIVEEKKKKISPLKIIIKIFWAVLSVAAILAIVYKYIERKYRSQILGKLDLDGDGEADAFMLDTTGNGEVDTIVIDSLASDCEDDDEI